MVAGTKVVQRLIPAAAVTAAGLFADMIARKAPIQ